MEFMEGGSLYEWLHSDLDIGWDVRLRYDETQSTPHSLVVLSISYTIDKDIVKRKKLEREERGEQERRLTVATQVGPASCHRPECAALKQPQRDT